jgi:quercetin dioxygenase-like cupin family protein
MKVNEVLEYLGQNYPGKEVIMLPPDDPTEILCETEPSAEHSEYSVAIAAIKRSALHRHAVTTETYEIIDGQLDLYIDGEKVTLGPEDVCTVVPGENHYAVGDFALAKVTSHPGWTPKDHILIKE